MYLKNSFWGLIFAVLLSVPALAQANEGEPAYLKAALLNGGDFDLSQHRGKIVMINFWATWCPACRAEFPGWQRVYKDYKGRDFEMIAVSIDRKQDVIRKFLKKTGYTVPVGWRFDPNEDDSFSKITKTPTTYFIGRDGKVAKLRVGRMSEAELRKTIEGLLKL